MAGMFTHPPDPEPYFETVWEIVREVPEGCVTTYGQVAAMIPAPDGVAPSAYRRLRARWVGTAMRETPAGTGVPWQRVINSQGTISLPPGEGHEHQRFLLESEGVEFDDEGRVDLAVFGWQGPSEDWYEARDLYPAKPIKGSRKGPSQPSLF